MIVKRKGKYVVMAESGRPMGTYDTEEEAKKRLRLIEYWKRVKSGK